MLVTTAIENMIEFYEGNIHDIDHFLKVWALAKTIGEAEKLDAKTQEILEVAAVIHDIACPLCRSGKRTAGGRISIKAAGRNTGCFPDQMAGGASSYLYKCRWHGLPDFAGSGFPG